VLRDVLPGLSLVRTLERSERADRKDGRVRTLERSERADQGHRPVPPVTG